MTYTMTVPYERGKIDLCYEQSIYMTTGRDITKMAITTPKDKRFLS